MAAWVESLEGAKHTSCCRLVNCGHIFNDVKEYIPFLRKKSVYTCVFIPEWRLGSVDYNSFGEAGFDRVVSGLVVNECKSDNPIKVIFDDGTEWNIEKDVWRLVIDSVEDLVRFENNDNFRCGGENGG